MAGQPPSGYGPQRDRGLASKARYGPRRPAELDEEVRRLRQSPEFSAMRRFARIHGALAEALPPHARGKVRAHALKDGTCTLLVADGVLCAELRSTCARRILTALAAAGTGATRLAWRISGGR